MRSSASIVWHCLDIFVVFVRVFLILLLDRVSRDRCGVCGGV